MSDHLSDLLHLEAARVPAVSRQPWQVRRAAEHHRRTRRVRGAVALTALAAAVAVAALLGGQRADTARPVPADSSSPRPTATGILTLAAHPTLTEGDWNLLTGGGTEHVDRSGPASALHSCAPDPGSLTDPAHTYGTGYLQPNRLDRGQPARISEYVMRYADEAAAVHAYAEVYGHFYGCTDPTYDSSTRSYTPWPAGLPGPWDEMFVVEESRGDPADTGYFQLIAARDRNVVIVIESNGWGDRPSHTVEIALQRAIPSERGPCEVC